MKRRGPGPAAAPSASARAALAASLVLCALLAPARAVVRAVLDSNASSVDFDDLPALFGVPLAPEGLRGYLMEAKPANACQTIEGPPLANGSLGAIALIRRYNCTFDLKVLHAQRAGFEAAIVHNVRSDDLVCMAHVYEDLRRQIAIPSVFVGEAASQDLCVLLRCNKSAHVVLLPHGPPCPDPDGHPALAASWVLCRTLALATCAGLGLHRLWLWLRAWRGRAAAAAHAPAQAAAKAQRCRRAQVRIFMRHDDMCAICLDEYEEGERIKILPCSHTFHCKCLDLWFSRAAHRSCPVCKQSLASTEDGSDSAAESLGDENLSLPGHQTPIWAIQARLRSQRLELLARACPRPRRSARAAETAASSRAPRGGRRV